ncbi:DUF3486 family protein [Vibrio parahaemolyticus]|nr:DUF3486 family protein [Vibrio parahaemolyticus]
MPLFLLIGKLVRYWLNLKPIESLKMGRISKVDCLPFEVRNRVIKLIRTLSHGEALKAVNKLIEEQGLPDSSKLTKSSLSRYRVDRLHM